MHTPLTIKNISILLLLLIVGVSTVFPRKTTPHITPVLSPTPLIIHITQPLPDFPPQNQVQAKDDPEDIVSEPEIDDAFIEFLDTVDLVFDTEPSPVAEEVPEPSFQEINTAVRTSLVNLVCTTTNGNIFQPISGSGIIINEKGIILTNAHVAQYLLLNTDPSNPAIECVVRMGSPAQALYKAKPLYISESWIYENAADITAQNPQGTGENDFAFLAITSKISKEALPELFPFTPLTPQTNLAPGTPLFIGGYPAGFLSGITIQKNLHITSTLGQVAELFTFGSGLLDLISIEGSIVSQSGVSGGAVVDMNGNLTALIVTSTQADSTENRILGAITLEHIDRSLLIQTGGSIATLLSQSIPSTIKWFAETKASALSEALLNSI